MLTHVLCMIWLNSDQLFLPLWSGRTQPKAGRRSTNKGFVYDFDQNHPKWVHMSYAFKRVPHYSREIPSCTNKMYTCILPTSQLRLIPWAIFRLELQGYTVFSQCVSFTILGQCLLPSICSLALLSVSSGQFMAWTRRSKIRFYYLLLPYQGAPPCNKMCTFKSLHISIRQFR